MDCFSETPKDIFDVWPICVNHFISGNWFESIYSSLKFTVNPSPTFWDKLFEAQHMINKCDNHMHILFIPYWISCLDESMSILINKFKCLVFIFYSCKPRLKGYEYHTISCGESGIIYGWYIDKKKYHPSPRGRPGFDISSNMKTVGPMLPAWFTNQL